MLDVGQVQCIGIGAVRLQLALPQASAMALQNSRTCFVMLTQDVRRMNQELSLSPATPRSRLLEVLEASAATGEWSVPAVSDVSLAMALSDHAARWRDSRGRRRSEEISTGAVCNSRFNQSRSIDMRNAAQYAIVLLRNEALEQIRHETRPNLSGECRLWATSIG
jgi:hypothetical protein